MVCCENTGRDDISPRTALSRVDETSGKNTSGPCLQLNGAILEEPPCKDVFIISDCKNALENQIATASHCRNASTVIGMFPGYAVILNLINTHSPDNSTANLQFHACK